MLDHSEAAQKFLDMIEPLLRTMGSGIDRSLVLSEEIMSKLRQLDEHIHYSSDGCADEKLIKQALVLREESERIANSLEDYWVFAFECDVWRFFGMHICFSSR